MSITHPPQPAQVRRGAVYCRVSTTDQAERGTSLDGQLQAIRSYCDRERIVIVGEWADVQTGRDPQRPGYQAMLAVRDSYDCLVVWRLDRLGRDEPEFFATYAAFSRAGIAILSVTEPGGSPLMAGILAVLAAEESRRLGQRVTLGMRQRIRDGYWPGKPPFGYRLVRAEGLGAEPLLVVEPIEASLYLEAVSRVEGGESLRAVASDWNQRGIARRSMPAQWYASTVAVLLRSPVHAGRLRWAGMETIGRHEPIIDLERWEALQQRLQSRPRPTHLDVARQGQSYGLLTGMIRCCCGAAMTHVSFHNRHRPASPYRYYACTGQRNNRPCPCPMPSYRAAELEDHVTRAIDAIAALSANEIYQFGRASVATGIAQEHHTGQAHRERLERRIRQLEDDLTGYRTMRARGEMTEDEYLQDRQRTLAALDQARTALASLPPPPPPAALVSERAAKILRKMVATWRRTTIVERRALLIDLGLTLTRQPDNTVTGTWGVAMRPFLPVLAFPAPSTTRRRGD